MNENHLAEEQSTYARNPAIQLPSCIGHPASNKREWHTYIYAQNTKVHPTSSSLALMYDIANWQLCSLHMGAYARRSIAHQV
jgi:hypothetical protein